ncbi:MAG TPA: hypothetical protein VFW15_03185 [Thermoanaerobaculia bacterium]|nr:hypothetical protein [Thermoanaerobaculia bacterium]
MRTHRKASGPPVLAAIAFGLMSVHAAAQTAAGPFSMDPCTLPDLGFSGARGWVQGSPGRYFVVLTDLSAKPERELNVADGFTGYKPGETILLGVDLRSREGERPEYPVVVRVRVRGGHDGSVRPAGASYQCREIAFFWNRRNGRRFESAVDRIELTVGSDARLAGFLPDETVPRRTRPLWAMTERLRIEFGKTDAARDEQHRDGEAEYPIRPEGVLAAGSDSKLNPNPFSKLNADSEFFGPNLDSEDFSPILEPFRAYVAVRDPKEGGDVIWAIGVTKREKGELLTAGERLALRRLGSSAVFVASFIVLPEGHPDATTVPGRLLTSPVLVAPFGLGDIEVEREEKKP